MNSICIYCASSDQIDEKYFEAARELGRLMGERGMTLVNGAGNMGLMRAGSKGKPMDCVSCGLCTEHCPQSIDVPRYMAALTEKVMPNHKK